MPDLNASFQNTSSNALKGALKISMLVTGGAGYIGSHMVRLLVDLGHSVVTFDDLSSGFRDAVLGGEFVNVSLHDKSALSALLGKGIIGDVPDVPRFNHHGR